MPLLTIFTPVYNRAHLINRVYESLLLQEIGDFEWIVVDDGSGDNIASVMQAIIADAPFSVHFFSQENGGKHIAINHGVSKAVGKLFQILDSDDVLPAGAVKIIKSRWNELLNDPAVNLSEMAGMCGVRTSADKKPLTVINYITLDADYNFYHYNLKILGDKAEVFITEILKRYPFPDTPGEKFCPEALVWHRIGHQFKLRYFNDAIYEGDYLAEGLTHRTIQVRASSPINTVTLYKELADDKNIPFYYRFRAAINYWRFFFYNKAGIRVKENLRLGTFWAIFCYPIGLLFYLKDNKKS